MRFSGHYKPDIAWQTALELYEGFDDTSHILMGTELSQVEEVRLIGIDNNGIVPLVLSDNMLTLQVDLDLAVDGSATIVDYDNSVWDSEDKCYIITSFSIMEFKDATGRVTAEIQIRLSDNQSPTLDSIKLMAPHGVTLTVDENKLEFTDLSFDATDAREDMMDALEEYYRH